MRVSVAIITYNHEDYIAQAVTSALEQNADFDYEIVIGEDCSTDRTRSIVLDFQRAHPGKVRMIGHDANVGAMKNFVGVFNACQGDYIAVLDGDDYWCSPDKLQRQVDFLDSHRDCTVCFHASRIMDQDGQEMILYPPGRKQIYTFVDLISKGFNFISSCTLMVRGGLFDRFPDWMPASSFPGDWIFALMHARQGDVGYIDDAMGVYRRHDVGVWSSLGSIGQIQSQMDFYRKIDQEFGFEHTRTIRRNIRDLKLRLMIHRHLAFIVPFARTILRRVANARG